MEKQGDGGTLEGIRPKNGCRVIHHLFFANDSLFFIKRAAEKAMNLKGTLEDYCIASGQQVNFAKSILYFNAGVDETLKRDVTKALGVQHASNPSQYLGLPTIWRRSRRDALNFLMETIWDKIQGWSNKLLNNAGKEVFIKVVITSIPTYVVKFFCLTSTQCAEFNAMIARFWWGPIRGIRRYTGKSRNT